MYKIKVTCNWTSSEEITKLLISQFKITEEDIKDFTFVYDEDFDVHVVFGYVNTKINNTKPLLIFPQEPSWSGNHPKNFENFDNLKIFGYNKSNYNLPDKVIETVAHMFYGGRGSWEEGFDNWSYSNLTSHKFEKTKGFCSFVSNRGINEPHPENCLYSDRINLIENIYNKLDFIDFYGWGNQNNLKPFVSKKFDAIKDYKFCLTIENSNEDNYITEKFYDCILTNTIPIYFGCKNVKTLWPENGYFLLENISDYKYVSDFIKNIFENSEEIYYNMLPNLLKMKDRYFNEFNLLKKIKKELFHLK